MGKRKLHFQFYPYLEWAWGFYLGTEEGVWFLDLGPFAVCWA